MHRRSISALGGLLAFTLLLLRCSVAVPADGADSEVSLRSARAAYERAATPTDKVTAGLALTRALRATRAPERLAEAEPVHQWLIANTSDSQRLLALNEYAVTLMAMGRMDDALARFGELEEALPLQPSPEEKVEQARYVYNVGRAWHRKGSPENAVPRYAQALILDGTTSGACEQLDDLAEKGVARAQILDALQELNLAHREACTFEVLREIDDERAWQEDRAAYERLPALFAEYLVAAQIDAKEYPKTREVLELDPSCASCTEKLQRIDNVYAASNRMRAVDLAGPWRQSDIDRTAFARLVTMVGHQLLAAGQGAAALQRFAAALRVDPYNIQAAIYALDTYTSGDLDPAEITQLLPNMPGLANRLTPNPSTVRLHELLAKTYEKLDAEGAWSARAMRQWDLAGKEHDELRRKGVQKPDPDLLASRASALVRRARMRRERNDALDEYFEAARCFLDAGLFNDALLVGQEMQLQAGAEMLPNHRVRLDSLRSRISEDRHAAGAAANDWEAPIKRWIANDRELAKGNLTIESQEHKLRIAGKVPSEDARRWLHAMTRDLPGVQVFVDVDLPTASP